MSTQLMQIGVVIESRIQLFGALAEAAELEHNLMCLYLYSMFGLKRSVSEGLSEKELAAVDRWRKEVLGIALEEMTHLTLVSNIASALGGSPQFMRPNFPASPGLYPADIVTELAPFSLATLDHFIYLERPRSQEVEDGATFDHRETYVREAPKGRLMPYSGDYPTVGTLYRIIQSAIESLCEKLGADQLFCGSHERQIGPLDAALPGLIIVKCKDSALKAIETIVTQGEGATTTEGSHFARFCAIKKEYEELLRENPDFNPSRAIARNPVMRKPLVPEGRVWVTEPLAAQFMDLGNALYSLMLRMLVQVYAFEDRSKDSKKTLLNVSFELMHSMSSVAEVLTLLRARPEGDSENAKAGLSFAMVRTLAPIELGIERIALAERLTEIHETLEHLDRQLQDGAFACEKDSREACVSKIISTRKVVERLNQAIQGEPIVQHQSSTNAQVATSRSGAKPLSHAPSEQNPAPAPASEVETAESGAIRMKFETKRCIHARHCVTELPKVFLANTPGKWLYPDATDAETLAAVIRECPSGALSYERKDGGPAEPLPQVNLIHLRQNGPYAVLADAEIDGQINGFRATLCRCGLSSRKPFCDGTHVSAKFDASGEPETQDTTALKARGGKLKIQRTENGPLQVTGPLELLSGTGRIIVRTEDVKLCRCGHSQTKPICDGSHISAGFRDSV